jgi:hypothetical protein
MLLEDQIRDLCERAVEANDEQAALRILEELRTALHQHTEAVREKLIATSSFSTGRSRASAKKAA